MPPARKKTPRTARAKASSDSTRIYVYTGSDEGQVREAARARVSALSGGSIDAFGTEVIDGIAENTESATQIVGRTIEALLTLPFFGGDKVVWLKNANFFGDTITGRSQRTLAAAERLLGVLTAGLPPEVSFVLSAGVIDERRRFYLQLKKLAEIEKYERLNLSKPGWEREVMERTAEKARVLGLHFVGDSLLRFVMRIGDDSMQIASELEKLDLYLGDRREARVVDVEAVAAPTRGGVVFEIGNAIERREAKESLDRIDHLMQLGETPVGILLAAVVPKIRSMLAARELMDRYGLRATEARYGIPADFKAQVDALPAEAAALTSRSKGGAPNYWGLYFACVGAKRFTMAELRRAMESCLRANLRLVRTMIDPRVVLHEMVIEILAREDSKRAGARSPELSTGWRR